MQKTELKKYFKYFPLKRVQEIRLTAAQISPDKYKHISLHHYEVKMVTIN